MILGHGASNPQVMLVADFAQGEDLNTKYALSGWKEAVLRTFSKNAQLNYSNFYRTLLIKDELPKLNSDIKVRKHISEADLASIYIDNFIHQYRDILINEIRELKPNLIVPLGEMGFQFLTNLKNIRKFRGSVLPLASTLQIEKYTKVLPILGPYPYLNKDSKQRLITQLDFKKIPKWSGEDKVPDDLYRIWVCRNSTSFRNFINRCYPVCAAKTIEEGGFLVFDIESYMNIPTCISFCFDGFESCCVPLLDESIDKDTRVLMWELVAKLLVSPIPKVNQNIKYDWKTLERWDFKVSNVVGDTMLASSTIYCEFPKNLGFLTSIYTDLPYFKDEGRLFDPAKHQKDQFYLYNAKDSLATHQIYNKQIIETVEIGTKFVYNQLIKLIPIYRRMEDRGIRIDKECQSKLIAKYESLFNIHKLALARLTNQDNLNPLSSPVMNQLIFEVLGYNKIRGVTGTDEDSLNMLMGFGTPKHATVATGKSIIQEIIWCRKFHKILEILYLDIYPDGRFRCEFNLAGTETGRSSAGQTTDYFIKLKENGKIKMGSKGKLPVLGHSLQTIGKHGFFVNGVQYGTDIRSMFVPSSGFKFVEIDLSGAEARVDRVLSGQFDMDTFSNPGIHKLTGSWVFNCIPQDIVKGTLQYHLSKTVRHAGERGMMDNRFFLMAQDEGTGINLTLKEAKRILEVFHANEPSIRSIFHRDVEVCIKSTNCLVAPNGRRRDFFDSINYHTILEGISFLPQAVVSDQTKFSFSKTFDKCNWAYLLCETHDGALAELPIGREFDYYSSYKQSIEKPIDFRFGSLKRDYELVIPCEATSGENWGEMADLILE